MPAFFVTIALGAQQFDGQVGSHNCFVSRPWDWGIFYAPGTRAHLRTVWAH